MITNVMKAKFTFNLTQPLTEKPQPHQMRNHSDLINSIVELDSLDRFVKAITAGYTFCPSIFDGKRSSENWKESSSIFLDFDSGFTIDEALIRLNSLELKSSIIYTTFSSTLLKEKFRLGFIFDNPITSKELRDKVVDQLLSLFPEADFKCSDAARLFFGTNSSAKVIKGEIVDLIDFTTKLNNLVTLDQRITLKTTKTVNNLSNDDYKTALFSHILTLTNQKYSPIAGSIHNYSIRFFGFCNRFGIPLYEAIALADSTIPSNHNKTRAEDVYKRYSSQHSTYNFNYYNGLSK